MLAYEYLHVVSFEETNLVGNVYFAHHVRWQGRVRELFLRDHAPDVLQELDRGLSLVTTRVSCEYFAELFAFDQVLIRMEVKELSQSRVTMRYDYLRRGTELVARGEQQIACLRKEGDRLTPEALPHSLRHALNQFAEPGIRLI